MTTTLATLHRRRDEVSRELRSALTRLDPDSRTQAAYHLGWTDVDGRPVATGGGKAVRPTLALLSAEAAGAPAEVGLPGAVAVELVHNFSLLHDDLMDGDERRRHRATVWAVWGPASAVLTGDALLALAFDILLTVPSPHAARAARSLSAATGALIRGQARDLAFERRHRVSLDECLEMAAGKTGALMSVSAAIGAVLAGASTATVDALAEFGAQLGLAFQLVDDILGIWGDPAATGKPAGSDLRARKKSLPVTYAVEHGGAAGAALAAWLNASDEPDETSLRRAADLVVAAGGRDWAAAEAHRRLAQASRAIEAVEMPAGTRTDLTELARFIVAREA
jgi:geranylgeranyl diphosphate synthase type I